MEDHFPTKIIVTSGNRKRRWRVYVGADRILSAVELYFDKNAGEWQQLTADALPESGNAGLKHY
jgi:hypothetical protein